MRATFEPLTGPKGLREPEATRSNRFHLCREGTDLEQPVEVACDRGRAGQVCAASLVLSTARNCLHFMPPFLGKRIGGHGNSWRPEEFHIPKSRPAYLDGTLLDTFSGNLLVRRFQSYDKRRRTTSAHPLAD